MGSKNLTALSWEKELSCTLDQESHVAKVLLAFQCTRMLSKTLRLQSITFYMMDAVLDQYITFKRFRPAKIPEQNLAETSPLITWVC